MQNVTSMSVPLRGQSPVSLSTLPIFLQNWQLSRQKYGTMKSRVLSPCNAILSILKKVVDTGVPSHIGLDYLEIQIILAQGFGKK